MFHVCFRKLTLKTPVQLCLWVLVQVCLCTWTAAPCLAEDKNGVSPNTISLPSGPGSIEGLGEAFQPMLNTGTAKYGVKVALPAGVAGHTPQLSLSYESGYGDGPAGIGWRFGPGGVSRQTDKGIPRYVDGPNGLDDDHDGEIDEVDEVDRFIGLEDEELVPLSDGTFRARIEGTFIRYLRVKDAEHDHWEAYLKDGTKLELGLTPQARIADQSGARVFKWLLEKSTDTNGNVIEFYYRSFWWADNQKYLSEIRYGPGSPPWAVFYFAYLSYEDRPDSRKDYRSGFLVKTAKRLARIDVGIQGVTPEKCAEGDWNRDDAGDALIRRYILSYDPAISHSSFLSKVTKFGSDGVNYLPPIAFSYSVFSPETTTSAAGSMITSPSAPSSVMDSQLVELIDLNRDGLPDMLKTDYYGGSHAAYFNRGARQDNGGYSIEWDEGRAVTSADGLALALHLAEHEVHLADMDGDGISDLVQTSYSGEVFYFLNGGDGSWGERRRMSIQDTAPPPPFTNDDVKTSDLDFDKRMDVVKSSENGYSIWFNLRAGKYSEEVRTPGASFQGRTIRFSETGVHLADMNGDRMSDVSRVRPAGVLYCANMGHGRFDDAVAMALPDTVLTDGTDGQVGRARLEDINGDGLADLVVERAEGGELWYWLNLGGDTFSTKHVITDMPTTFGQNVVTRWADMNGNGTTDLVYADSLAESRLRVLDIGEMVGGSAHPNLLIGIDNGLGVQTEITYRSSTEYCTQAREQGQAWSTTIPFPVTVVAQVSTTTGLDVDTVTGIDEYIKSYTYRDGFYEDREKAFRGFSEVAVEEFGDSTAPTRVTTHSFFTGGPDGVDNDDDGDIDEIMEPWWHREEDALKGVIRGVEVRAEDGFPFLEEKNDWRVKNLIVGIDNVEVRFAFKQGTEKLIWEGTGTPETLRTTFSYDDFGNVTAERKYGALSINGDEAFTFTEYVNDTGAWRIGFPKRQYVTDVNGQRVSETFSYYDGPDYVGLPLGQVAEGNLSRQEGWVEGGNYIDLVRNAYDSYGNIVGILDSNGNRRTITYDRTLQLFPEQEAIEVDGGKQDLTVTAAYNLGLGVLGSSTDFNGHQTAYGYDTFGRLTSIVKPGDSSDFPTLSFSYTMTDPTKGLVYSYDADGVLTVTNGAAAPSSVKTRAREVSGQAGTFDTIQYVDGMGRKLATVEEGEEGFVVNEAVLFNAAGTVRFAFLPYSSMSAAYAAPVAGNPAVETDYDATGRVCTVFNPPDSVGMVTYSSNRYLPLEKKVTDENAISKSLFSDGLERLVSVHEDYEEEILVTRYTYDPLGNLTQITDAQNNVKTLEYDGLSRRTVLKDPDRGRMDYVYDAAGNLIQSVNNKGQLIVYTYDGANRMLTEDYLDDAAITPDVEYLYDTPSEDYPYARNTRGKLVRVKDLSGALYYSYDARGNVEWSVRRITELSRDFMFLLGYDAMGRVVSQTFPDGDQITYTYNPRALLESIPGFVDSIDYYPSGQIRSYGYANGLASTYSYDPRNRLTRLTTDRLTPTGSPIQDLGYSFDGVSNITGITDYRDIPAASPKKATQAFQYDELYRLTRAEGPGYGAIDYRYDKSGNMTFKGSPAAPDPQHIDDPLVNLGAMTSGGTGGTSGRGVKLPGDAPGPHAITGTASGLVFDYDDNGNMINRAGDMYEWDFKDRLVKTTTPETVAEYVYDYSGRRVIKKAKTGDNSSAVYYVGKGYEIRDGKTVKYVFAGDRRVAKVEGRLAGGGEKGWQVLNFRSGWNFFSLDVEPDDPSIDAVLGSIAGNYTEVWAFDPESKEYRGYVPASGISDLTEIHAQQGYIIRIATAATALIAGTRRTEDINLQTGWNLIPCPADTVLPLKDALASVEGEYLGMWGYDTATGDWQNFTPDHPAFLSTLSAVDPGRAYWIKTKSSVTLVHQSLPRKVYFYHPDHLGSSNLVTDETGSVVEGTEFYPFGRPRYEEKAGFDSAYKYTGKELDRESDLMYYEARYYDAAIGRFTSVDPLAYYLEGKASDPTPYEYAANNPVVYHDPKGLAPRVFSEEERKKIEREITSTQSVVGFAVAKHQIELHGGKYVEGNITQYIDEATGGIITEEYVTGKEGELSQGQAKVQLTVVSEESQTTVTIEVDLTRYKGKRLTEAELRKEVAQAFVQYNKYLQQKYAKPTPPPPKPPQFKVIIGPVRIHPQFRVTIGPVEILTPPSRTDECLVGMCHPDFPFATVDPEYGYGGERACFPNENE
jgi:RHS repeat-associated protein